MGKLVLNEFGTIVRDEWLKTAEIRDNIESVYLGYGYTESGKRREGTARRAPTPWNTLTDLRAGFSPMFDFIES